MDTGLSQDEIHWLLKDMAEVCLRPPKGEAERMLSTPVSVQPLGRKFLSPVMRLARVLDAVRPCAPLLLLAVALAPLVALTLCVALAGPVPTLLGMGVSALAGTTVLLRQGPRPFATLAACIDGLHMGRNVPLVAIRRGLTVFCGVLLLLPDPLTTLIGVMAMLPGLREPLAEWLQQQTSPRVVLG